jgi:hypothetical protein
MSASPSLLPCRANPFTHATICSHAAAVASRLMLLACRLLTLLQTDAQRKASELGIALVVPDTSPPQLGIAGEEEWALGVGAGFYVDAVTGAVSPAMSKQHAGAIRHTSNACIHIMHNRHIQAPQRSSLLPSDVPPHWVQQQSVQHLCMWTPCCCCCRALEALPDVHLHQQGVARVTGQRPILQGSGHKQCQHLWAQHGWQRCACLPMADCWTYNCL